MSGDLALIAEANKDKELKKNLKGAVCIREKI